MAARVGMIERILNTLVALATGAYLCLVWLYVRALTLSWRLQGDRS